MNWYVIMKLDADLPTLREKIESAGGQWDPPLRPVDLGADEQLVEVIGPKDLPQRIGPDPKIVVICPVVELEDDLCLPETLSGVPLIDSWHGNAACSG